LKGLEARGQTQFERAKIVNYSSEVKEFTN
jgi:hypothetical protein